MVLFNTEISPEVPLTSTSPDAVCGTCSRLKYRPSRSFPENSAKRHPDNEMDVAFVGLLADSLLFEIFASYRELIEITLESTVARESPDKTILFPITVSF